jgi:uncharacterized DUF497 family protein
VGRKKAATNLEKHGVPFAYAARVFLDPGRQDAVDDRKNDAEPRRLTFGKIDGLAFVISYTLRDSVIRLISARKANHRENKRDEEI